MAKSDSDTLPVRLPPEAKTIQRELDELQTLLTDRRNLLMGEVSLLLRAFAGLIAFVAQHPDPHIRRQRLHDLQQALGSVATIVRLVAKNPIADRVKTIRATKGRSALTPKIDEIIATEASGIQQRHPKWSHTEVARQIKKRVNKQIAVAAAKAGVNTFRRGAGAAIRCQVAHGETRCGGSRPTSPKLAGAVAQTGLGFWSYAANRRNAGLAEYHAGILLTVSEAEHV